MGVDVEPNLVSCQDYMRREYGDEVADSVSRGLGFVRFVLLIGKVEKVFTTQTLLPGVQSGDKMKIIEKYVSRDGAEFRTEADALHREELLDKVKIILSILPEHPNTTDFTNGNGYIQHKESKIQLARTMLIELAKEELFSDIDNYDIHSYVFGRYLDDSSARPLYDLYCRIVLCVDDNTWREYGQPYLAIHPDEAKQVRINP